MIDGKRFMVIAGESSGDFLAAELIRAIQTRSPNSTFFGAGGERMASVGAEVIVDMTRHSVIGIWEAILNYTKFKRLFNQLIRLAFERKPDCIICVDFSGFNRRFARKIRKDLIFCRELYPHWTPRIIQLVSPQVWASRPGRAKTLAEDLDLLLSIIPFEKTWYAKHTPRLHVEFVGNPLIDRHANIAVSSRPSPLPLISLLPGSREAEFTRHLPVMIGAVKKIRNVRPVQFSLVLQNAAWIAEAKRLGATIENGIEIQTGTVAESLRHSQLAIAATGTVTLECALFGVPTVCMYKTSWTTYQVAKRIISVQYLAMPNLLANEELFPEFVQNRATADNISRAALELLADVQRCDQIRTKLKAVVESLGSPGASGRAADAVLKLFKTS